MLDCKNILFTIYRYVLRSVKLIRNGQKIRWTRFEARFLFQILLKMRSVAGYTPDSLVEFEAKILFKCSSYLFAVP